MRNIFQIPASSPAENLIVVFLCLLAILKAATAVCFRRYIGLPETDAAHVCNEGTEHRLWCHRVLGAQFGKLLWNFYCDCLGHSRLPPLNRAGGHCLTKIKATLAGSYAQAVADGAERLRSSLPPLRS